MFKTLIALVLATALVGCASTPTTELKVTQAKTVYVTVPESLLVKCIPEKPMSTTSYFALQLEERELTLSKYILSMYGTLAICNKQLDGIRQLNASAETPTQ